MSFNLKQVLRQMIWSLGLINWQVYKREWPYTVLSWYACICLKFQRKTINTPARILCFRSRFELGTFRIRRTRAKNMSVLWVVVPYSLTEFYRSFRGACCLHHLGVDVQKPRRQPPSEPQISNSRAKFSNTHFLPFVTEHYIISTVDKAL
jgi:hypothetical protein